MEHEALFVDWVSLAQHHPQGGLPIVVSGVKAVFDRDGNCRHECALSESVRGSYDSTLRVLCDGFRVSLSGNVGRFGRPDNLFNLGWSETVERANRILAGLGLPPFTTGEDAFRGSPVPGGSEDRRDMFCWGATLSRIDITCNYRAGSDPRARAVIRWLAGRSVARMKRGYAGDDSVWFANSRHMLKAYRKGAEMKAHGCSPELAQWAEDQGIVRVEVELKRRLLHELGMNRIADVTDEKLLEIYRQQTEVFRRVDLSDEPDILEAIPQRYRVTAAAWLAGQDVRSMMSRATLFRHARVLREHGIDILEPRDVQRFPVRVRVIDLEPVKVPDWYSLEAA